MIATALILGIFLILAGLLLSYISGTLLFDGEILVGIVMFVLGFLAIYGGILMVTS